MTSQQPQVTSYRHPRQRGRAASCLIWAVAAAIFLLMAAVLVIVAAYAGWGSGVETARANATVAAAVTQQNQCELIPQDLATGNFDLARRRIESLRSVIPAPDCLLPLLPTATAAYLMAQPSPTLIPTITALPTLTAPAPTATPPPVPASATPAEDDSSWTYDLGALLAEARAEIQARDFVAAIDTLEAIIGLDSDYNRDQVRGLALQALSAQALLLYRSGKLSEAIVLTDRAEVYGDIGELNYERYVAEQYLTGQRYKTTNPALAVLRFNEIYYQHNSNYMNGQVAGELQDALRYYGDALALQGDACQAKDQYAAALELYPNYSPVSRGELTTKQQQTTLACGTQAPALGQNGNGQSSGTPQAIGVRTTAAGQSG
ncbi:MAG: hypothetical protein J4G18_01910 [Anaerolineae bacterium]|nr:hypothetical protein [Anaerolineae bacterium]